MAKKLPEDQSNEEWLRDYDDEPVADYPSSTLAERNRVEPPGMSRSVPDKKLYVVPSTNSNNQILTGEFLYREHRTVPRGRLVLEFMHVETGKCVVMFFNVDIVSKKTGKKYPAGRGGRFTCNSNTKFAKFWEAIFKKPPRRWSRAHHELHKLKKLKFIGEAILKYKKDGSGSYWELVQGKAS